MRDRATSLMLANTTSLGRLRFRGCLVSSHHPPKHFETPVWNARPKALVPSSVAYKR